MKNHDVKHQAWVGIKIAKKKSIKLFSKQTYTTIIKNKKKTVNTISFINYYPPLKFLTPSINNSEYRNF